MLLRNLDPSLGLANGTRLIVKGCTERLIDAEVLGKRGVDPHAGRRVFIPRLGLIADEHGSGLPFGFKRRQFPLKPSFAMTINKSQGQSLQFVGLFLPKPVFGHGQLYVAFSRVSHPNCLRVLAMNGTVENMDGQCTEYTQNVVYKEALLPKDRMSSQRHSSYG